MVEGGSIANETTLSAAVSVIGGGGSVGADAPTVLAGEVLGRYQIRRLLGRGGMGQVHLARDLTLGRSVALKLIGGAGDATQFLDEARAVARLNHPNIVQLYDFGTFRTGLFLALEYVDGLTLRDRARDESLALDEVLRHVSAIAAALAHAHASGVIHCDLKPSNVMIGRDGRVRVVDFGLAQLGERSSAAAGGTPDWMAPEQWSGFPLTDRVDTWALGLMTATLLAGTHPLGADPAARRRAALDPLRVPAFACARAVPPPVIDLVTRSLEPVPGMRPSAAEWQRILDEVLAGRGDELVEDGPFPGLTAFDERHARSYFGRESEIDELLERLRETPCLLIAGPSGAGKSSFLHAGVIPRLRARGRWRVLAFRPGADPIGALARQLDGDVAELRAELSAQPSLLAVRLATLALAHDSDVLLAVDQLEEVFTLGAPAPEQHAFLRMVLAAADDRHDRVRVVCTVRDELVGRLGGVRSVFVLPPLSEASLRRAVAGPLARYRYDVDDPALVDELVAALADTGAAALPLLQFACRTLWDGRDPATRTIRRATYAEMGGVAGALARHADRALAEMAPRERQSARRILLQLVAGQARRTVARAALVETLGADAGGALDRLVAARLLVQRRTDDSDEVSVEIAHESMLQSWGQLARWLDESRDERRFLEDLDATAVLWEKRGRRAEHTWAHDELVATRHRQAQLGVTLPGRVEAFVAAGEARHRAATRRRRIRVGGALAILGATAVLAGGAISRYLAREQRIRTNLGTIELVLAPYDRAGTAIVPVAADALPALTWRLYAASPTDATVPGEPVPPALVDVVASTAAGVRSERVSAPGGTVFFAISGRGRPGESCPPSWIRVQSFPGYAHAVRRIVLEVPTCQATRFDVAEIAAGPFVYGGPGESPSPHYAEDADYRLPERVIDLPRFAMDRREVPNAAYAPFGRLAAITGFPAPIYSSDALHAHDGDADHPATDIDAFGAAAFCRYLGKELPTDRQWVKAARGGLTVNGAPNLYPRRRYPWGPAPRRECVNHAGTEDGHDWVAPVDAFACGASPYGIVNLVGNVQEWISRTDQPDPENPQHVLRGGSVDSPGELDHTSTLFVNHHDPRVFAYSVGFRCVLND